MSYCGRGITLFTAWLTLAAGIAVAQTTAPTTPKAAPPGTSAQSACPPGVGENAPTVGSGQSGGNLSDQLASSNGIICPPAGVDSKMRIPAPETGRMPVIPPPGTQGGDQSVVPK